MDKNKSLREALCGPDSAAYMRITRDGKLASMPPLCGNASTSGVPGKASEEFTFELALLMEKYGVVKVDVAWSPDYILAASRVDDGKWPG